MKNIKLSLSFDVKGNDKNAIPVPGWEKNPIYEWSMSKTFYFDDKNSARKKAEELKKLYLNITNIDGNEIKEFQIAAYEGDNVQSYYFTYFKPRKEISFHDNYYYCVTSCD